jgi:hypothetical protein
VPPNKHNIEEIVRRVGHLPELYADARSEKKKINKNCCVSVFSKKPSAQNHKEAYNSN